MYIILTDGVFFLDCDRTFELADVMLKICVGINKEKEHSQYAAMASHIPWEAIQRKIS